jgi:ribA/ribD-fused uncharacterized protein
VSDINQFSGANRFLSNFYPSLLLVDGKYYPTVEHAFQAAKTDNPTQREQIRQARNAAEAKRLGRRVTLKPGWDQLRIRVMLDLLRLKFSDPELAAKLRATGAGALREGNHWGDRFWGVDESGRGENHLGHLLMQVREEVTPLDER